MAPKIVRVQLPVAPNIFDHLECETFARTSGRGGNSGSSWLAGRRNCVINSIAMCMWFLCFPDTNNSQSALRSPLGVRLTACGIYLRTINYYKCRGPRHPDPGMDSDPDPDPVAGYTVRFRTQTRTQRHQNIFWLQASEIVYENLWLQYLCRTASSTCWPGGVSYAEGGGGAAPMWAWCMVFGF